MVEGAHMAVDVTQVTLHRTRTRARAHQRGLDHALQVRHREILASPRCSRASRVLSHLSANLLFSRRHTHTLPALSAAAAAVAMGTRVWYRAEPYLPRTEKSLCRAMWAGSNGESASTPTWEISVSINELE